MKKNILFRAAVLLITLSATLPTMAEKISLSQARTIAKNFTGKALPFQSATQQSVSPALSLAYKSQSEELYAFNVGQGSGFVLVAGDDLVKNPVLGYCDEGTFNYDQLEGPAKDWVEQYAQTIAYARANNIVVESSSALASESNKEVGPLLTTTWDQYPVYNALCPKIGEDLLPTGCAATAMAQVMKYYNYPEHGIGSLGYFGSTEYNGTVYYYDCLADFANTTYDWANMPDILDANSKQAQINAVATLMYHCGVAQRTNYNMYGSSAYLSACLPALINYFGYDKSAQYEMLALYTMEEWTDSLKAELDAGRPILYGGQDENGSSGHLFILDGYNAEGYYHINWGWGGYDNGYFSLLKLKPEECFYDYTYNQVAWLHVMPEQGGKQTMELFDGLLSCYSQTLKLDTCGGMVPVNCFLIHFNYNIVNAKYYLTLENKADGLMQDVNEMEGEFMPRIYYRFNADKKCNFNGVKDGDYKLYPTYETDNVSKRKARGISTYQGYLDVTVKDGIVTIGENKYTGIHEVLNATNAAAKGDGSIFNLSGQKVGKDWEKLSPGIYLKGGEKIMKK